MSPDAVRPLRHAVALALATPSDLDLAVALAAMDTGRHRGPSGSGGSTRARTHEGDAVIDLRLKALVELARQGDHEAFGQLYDHYVPSIYRFIYYRVSSKQLAEDLTSETFMRALRSIQRFTWQGKDFGAWLTTIARNIVTDHYKSGRNRLETVVEEIPEGIDAADTPEQDVLRNFTSEVLMEAVNALPDEQRDCILMRFVQQLSIAQTADALNRSEGAIKQLQLRAIRNLAKSVPEQLR